MLANQFLATKFQPPPLRPGRVIRTRLVQKLEQGYIAGARLTLICAPAGYGKTTLAVEWLQQEKTFCWIGLDASDNDPHRFFTSLVTALQKIDPALGISTTSLLSISPQPPVERFVSELINELSTSNQAFLLVLDDYHSIHTQAIHEAMESLLNHQPANLHLVVTTREDPPFPLGRLRAGGQITEARQRDLRFTGEEVQSFLHQMHRLDLPPAALEKLLALTEGWAAGLQLTGMAFQNEQDAEAFLDTFRGTHQYIIEYLLEEVLRRQPEDIRSFLTRTSILERFNVSLCEALVEGAGDHPIPAREILASLERSNLFLTPLDSTRTWYRYHRLFADVLRSGLDQPAEVGLHLRAARWFEQHELLGEAIPHYLAAGETRAAGRLVSSLSASLVKNGELQILLGWLQALPEDEVRAYPQLLASHALALLLTGKIQQAAAVLESAIPPSGKQAGSGALLAVKAWLELVCGGSSGLRDTAQQALAELAPEETIFRALALLSLGTGFQVSQNLRASNEAFQEAYLLGLKMQHPFAALAGLTNLVFNLFDMGQLRKARAMCLDALPRFANSRGNPLPLQGMIAIPLAAIFLEQNDLAQARQYARLGRDLCQRMFSSGMMGGDAEVVLATVAFLEGDRDQAFAIADSLYRFAVEHQVAFLEDKMTALQADMYLRAGDLEGVRNCLTRFEIQKRALMATVPHFKIILEAQVLAAGGRLAEALDWLAPAGTCPSPGRTHSRITPFAGVQGDAAQPVGPPR